MILAAETADLDRGGSVVLKDAGVVFGSRASTNTTSLLVHLSTLHLEALLSSHAEICGQKGCRERQWYGSSVPSPGYQGSSKVQQMTCCQSGISSRRDAREG